MRIVYVSPYPPARDGIGDYTAAMVAAVRERGHEPSVVAARPDAGAPGEVIGSVPRTRSERAALVERIAAGRPDVIHLQFAVAAFGARTPALIRFMDALAALPARKVVTFHEVTRDTASLRSLGRRLYRRLAARADAVIVHTEDARAALSGPVGADPARTSVVPLPRPELPPAEATAAELRARHALGQSRILLAFGFIHVDKGLEDLVSALHLLGSSRAHDDVRLVVAGTVRPRQGPFRLFELRDRIHLLRVRRLIARLGLADRVAFTGYVPAGEVRPWFEVAQAVVLPYRRIEQSGVAGQAAAAAVPLLVSHVGGLTAGLGDARWTFPARDPEALAGVLEAFLAASPEGRAGAQVRLDASDMDSVVDATLTRYRTGAIHSPTAQEPLLHA
jgi:glycosyltransferase involved in cell wall biosynthesis